MRCNAVPLSPALLRPLALHPVELAALLEAQDLWAGQHGLRLQPLRGAVLVMRRRQERQQHPQQQQQQHPPEPELALRGPQAGSALAGAATATAFHGSGHSGDGGGGSAPSGSSLGGDGKDDGKDGGGGGGYLEARRVESVELLERGGGRGRPLPHLTMERMCASDSGAGTGGDLQDVCGPPPLSTPPLAPLPLQLLQPRDAAAPAAADGPVTAGTAAPPPAGAPSDGVADVWSVLAGGLGRLPAGQLLAAAARLSLHLAAARHVVALQALRVRRARRAARRQRREQAPEQQQQLAGQGPGQQRVEAEAGAGEGGPDADEEWWQAAARPHYQALLEVLRRPPEEWEAVRRMATLIRTALAMRCAEPAAAAPALAVVGAGTTWFEGQQQPQQQQLPEAPGWVAGAEAGAGAGTHPIRTFAAPAAAPTTAPA
ncbi:hypothetical protein GPECTOR_31g322 [Gonium pectorale]|uniref:Uncharacterized protein n=1 Tax=Gonium pectorale TaxID=33097 RepID=A0A150GF47_GONPE|nr:hypothetical protein GPECTOR_31g322 [Gonium pectorale]|eukprot:KXZ47960.1 hypothetical protein GPECTOR_31g322 [Gonium pectorale]